MHKLLLSILFLTIHSMHTALPVAQSSVTPENQKSLNGLLFTAVNDGNIQEAQRAIALGAQINCHFWMIDADDLIAIHKYPARTFDINTVFCFTPLHWAAFITQNPSIVLKLLHSGAIPFLNGKNPYIKDNMSRTPRDFVKKEIEEGFFVNKQNLKTIHDMLLSKEVAIKKKMLAKMMAELITEKQSKQTKSETIDPLIWNLVSDYVFGIPRFGF